VRRLAIALSLRCPICRMRPS